MSKACVAAHANVPARQERGQEGGIRDAEAFAAEIELGYGRLHLVAGREDNLVKLQVVPDVRAERKVPAVCMAKFKSGESCSSSA